MTPEEAEIRHTELQGKVEALIVGGKWDTPEFDAIAEEMEDLWYQMDTEAYHRANARGKAFWELHPELKPEPWKPSKGNKP